MDGLFLDLTGWRTDEFAKVGGFTGANGNGAHPWQVVGGSERRLHVRELAAVTEEDAWVDLCSAGLRQYLRIVSTGLTEQVFRVVQEHEIRLPPEVLCRLFHGYAKAYGI
ncbi:hypothetical protein [Streptomyces sp. NPDC050538]|uniref:hypothetical protein n=1 Tax=Streptomyces sp. NPDC050538 TaxID=3365627 RepID=UPI0037B29042